MGGQACVLYGAAEFSRDIDLAILADPRNLSRLDKVLVDLNAEPIIVDTHCLLHLLMGVHILSRVSYRAGLDVTSGRSGPPWDRNRRSLSRAPVPTFPVLVPSSQVA
jgi:hypothetical protein